jgi:hypothetical protein
VIILTALNIIDRTKELVTVPHPGGLGFRYYDNNINNREQNQSLCYQNQRHWCHLAGQVHEKIQYFYHQGGTLNRRKIARNHYLLTLLRSCSHLNYQWQRSARGCLYMCHQCKRRPLYHLGYQLNWEWTLDGKIARQFWLFEPEVTFADRMPGCRILGSTVRYLNPVAGADLKEPGRYTSSIYPHGRDHPRRQRTLAQLVTEGVLGDADGIHPRCGRGEESIKTATMTDYRLTIV